MSKKIRLKKVVLMMKELFFKMYIYFKDDKPKVSDALYLTVFKLGYELLDYFE